MRLKGTVVILMALMLALPVMAQEKQINFGFKGGINLANLSYDPDPDVGPDNLLGLAAGAVLSFNLSPSMSLDGEVLYIQKGASSEMDVMGCSSSSDLKLTYITISPMFRFKAHSDKLTPYFMGGVEFGLLMSADSEYEWDCNGVTESGSEDVKDYFKGTDFGITFGAGLEFPSGSSAFFLEGRYTMGLADISDTGDEENVASETQTFEIKNKGIYLLAGIRF